MKRFYTSLTTNMTELKRSPARVLEEAHGEPVAILNRNKAVAYLVPASCVGNVEASDLSEAQKLVSTVIKKHALALSNLKDR